MNLANFIVPAIIFVFILMRMLRESPLKESYKGSIIIIIIGAITVINALKGITLTANIIIEIIFACVSGLGFGLLRGTTIKVYYSETQNG